MASTKKNITFYSNVVDKKRKYVSKIVKGESAKGEIKSVNTMCGYI